MKRKNAISIFSMLIITQLVFCQVSQDRLYYISKYQKIAQEEMERTGVPASIKLAQAILESNGGKSELSRKANNHFGIKCGGSWDARTYFRMDDDKDDKGNDIESCFRVYKNPESSFVAHSEFLRGNKRYDFLFDMPINDYKSWAHGLKKAGYATNPKYPHLLIKIINDYELDQFDNLFEPGLDPMVASTDDNFMLEEIARIEGETRHAKAKETKAKKRKILAINHRAVANKKLNDISIVYAEHDDTPETIAAKTDVPMKRLFKYNDGLTNPNQALPENMVVFLQPKRKAFRGKKKFHKVTEGETIAQVSQKYGIQIDKLQERNRLAVNEEPLAGAILKIRGKRVPENMRIPTREVYALGDSNKKKEAKNMEKYATSLSDFEVPPTIQERKEQAEKNKNKRPFNFGKNKKVTSTKVSDNVPPVDSYKASPAYKEDIADAEMHKPSMDNYSASTSNNYGVTASSGSATFKEHTTADTKTYATATSRPSYTSPNHTVVTTKVPNGSSGPTSTVKYSDQNTSTINIVDDVSNVPNTGMTTTPSTTKTPTYSTTSEAKIATPQTIAIQYHTVVKGETLYRLSKNYGKSVDYIKQVNGLNSNTISIGQKLIVN